MKGIIMGLVTQKTENISTRQDIINGFVEIALISAYAIQRLNENQSGLTDEVKRDTNGGLGALKTQIMDIDKLLTE